MRINWLFSHSPRRKSVGSREAGSKGAILPGTRHRRTPRFFLLLLLLLLTLPHNAAAQTRPPIVYESWDVVVDLLGSGEYVVTETQRIRFNGEYSSGFAEIPREFTEDISRITVANEAGPFAEGGSGPGTFSVERASDFIYVDWNFIETRIGDVRTFIISYQVKGGLAYYATQTRLDWEIIPADRSGIPVEAASFTVNFPPQATVDMTAVQYGSELEGVVVATETETAGGGRLTATAPGAIADGTAWQAVVVFPPGIVEGTAPQWQQRRDARELVYQIDNLDVDLAILADGTVQVNERQLVSVLNGAMAEGFRTFNRLQLDTIGDIQIFEGPDVFGADDSENCYYCFTVDAVARRSDWVYFNRSNYEVVFDEEHAGSYGINWYFPALIAGDSTEFELQYTVAGAVALGDDGQRLVWTVIPGYQATTAAAAVHLTLPPGVNRDDVTITADDATLVPQADGSIIIRRNSPVYTDSAWTITILLPAGATSAPMAQWQQDVTAVLNAAEAARQEDLAAERRKAQQQLAVGAGAILLGLGGLAAVLLIWYLRGRDAPLTDLVAEYVTEPPSDLAPGLVAFLLDEGPSPRGVLASIFELATLGLIQIDLSRKGSSLQLRRNWPEALEKGQTIETPAGATTTIPDHLVVLFNNLQPNEEKWSDLISIDTAWTYLKLHLPGIYHEMRQAGERFFADQPETIRHRWLVIGQVIALLGVLGLGIAWWYSRRLGPVLYWPPISVIVTGLAFIAISRWMPRRTEAGAVEAARWHAFKRYLKDLQGRGDLAEAQAILDQHFAYVVALDLADIVIKEVAAMGAGTPVWTAPRPLYRPDLEPDRPPGVPRSLRARPGGGAGAAPDQEPSRIERWSERPDFNLQTLSDTFTRKLNNASRGLTDVLNSAIGDVDDTPFEFIVRGAKETTKFTWKATTTTAQVLFDVMTEIDSGSGSGSGGYRGGSGSSRSFRSSSSSRRSSFSSSRSSSRSFSSSRSSGGRRGFR